MYKYILDPFDNRNTPYERFKIDANSTPEKINEAYMQYISENPQDLVEATQEKELLLETEERLKIDFFYYMIKQEEKKI